MIEYLSLMSKIYEEGEEREDRTGIGTFSLFGEQLRFDMRKGFPIITTKKIFWKGIVEELLFFISGETDTKILSDKGVRVWEANTTREFLDNRGLSDYPEYEMGPGYGHQMRNFNGTFSSHFLRRKNIMGQYNNSNIGDEDRVIIKSPNGIDQLKALIDGIKRDPYSRRHIITLWNPCQLKLIALPPCHGVVTQFYVSTDGHLDLHTYQRSCDYFLGFPWNLSSYALLGHLISQVCDLSPRHLIYSFGDVHLYKNHKEAIATQLQRKPKPLPKLQLNEDIKDIELFRFEDCQLLNYEYDESIKAEMAV